ncbi:MAG: hypothetical protein J6A59_05070, partial [Lachnospiraceae bacterium]|nr:hypothetical protein [Lachnospiraceae bacterium]
YTQDISGYNYYSYPDILQLEYDAACNLACPSCRNNYVCDSGKKAEHITSYVLKNIVPYITHIRCAGFGEALFSKNYKHIISSEETRNKELYLLTNGLLLDYKKAMDLLCHFSKLSIDVSVDAGTEEVYKLIRGGNYSLLIRNLHDISKLHLSGNISKFVLNYTVSKKNICDLNHFLKMAEDLNVDSVRISAIHNWGNMTKDEFEDMSILDANFKLKSEVCEYFKNMDAFDVKILDNNVGFEELTKT